MSLHGGASKEFVSAYNRFLEQLEGAFSEKFNLKSATGFDPKQAAAAIFTPTFGTVMYGETKKSAIAVPKTWVEPTAKTLEKFFPEKGEDIDYIEEVHETVTMEVYCAKFFKQCEKERAMHTLSRFFDASLNSSTLVAASISDAIRVSKNSSSKDLEISKSSNGISIISNSSDIELLHNDYSNNGSKIIC